MSITDAFCGAFKVRNDFIGPTARLIALGELPEGVDHQDQRVNLIVMLCRVGDGLPTCRTCRGSGVFQISMSRDLCMDCYGCGVEHPSDAELRNGAYVEED